MLRRDRAQAEALLAQLEAGTPFEEVAAGQFPEAHRASRPWDLGFLRWAQLPEPWREVIPDLSAGQSSGIIAGPGGRFWIIHLVAERQDPTVDFESARPALENALRARAVDEARARIGRELRERATIEYVDP